MGMEVEQDVAEVEPWVPRQSLDGPAWFAVLLPSLPAVLLWMTAPSVIGGFATPAGALRSLGLLFGLCAYSTFATNLVLGARIPWIERLFRSLDRMYRFHRRLGTAVGGLLAVHVVLMAGSALLTPAGGLRALFSGTGMAAGAVALAGFAGIVAVSLFGRMRHETFQRVHRLIGLVFAVAALHVMTVPGLAAAVPALHAYLVGASVVGVGAWLHRSVLGSRLVRRHPYRVARISTVLPDVNELALVPRDTALRFEPGQFVFIAIDDEAVTREAHPFSITSGPQDTELRLVIKALGDFTEGLGRVAPGAPVVVEGPYGGFWHGGARRGAQVWIAGGIGVTPFLAMVRSLEQVEAPIDVFLCAESRPAMPFLQELEAHAARLPGLRVHPVPLDTEGFLTAERVARTAGALAERDVFLCGPGPMVDALVPQLRAAGVPADQLHYEEFRLRGRR